MSSIEFLAPLDGWLVPLHEVPDPVFSGGLAGDGVAIDPVDDTLHAPCEGTVRLMRGGSHALTLVTVAGDLLLHVGIDTVTLQGDGFELLVRDGASVRAGDPLLRFDLDLVARRAPSVVTPVVLTGPAASAITRHRAAGRVRVGDVLFSAIVQQRGSDDARRGDESGVTQTFRVPFDHGLHARPAASVGAALAGIDADVEIRAHGRHASARSMLGLMTLGVARGDLVEVVARGPAAAVALTALDGVLERTTARASEGADDPIVRTPAPPPGSIVRAVVASRGIAIGRAYRWLSTPVEPGTGSGDAQVERRALATALQSVATHLTARASLASGPRRDVLEAHLALLGDPELRVEAEGRMNGGASASLAWHDALRAATDRLAKLDDPRMAERRADLRDLAQQVLRVLVGDSPNSTPALPAGTILIAEEILPSQLLSLDLQRVAAICTASGGATSHVAILAASLGIPMLVAAGSGVLAIGNGTLLVVDAEEAFLRVSPSHEDAARCEARIATRSIEAADDARRAHEPALLVDGTRVRVDCNLGSVDDAAAAVAAGADGCGLLRTEFLFLGPDTAPTEAEQHAVYAAIATVMGGRPLTIRTLDAGGDKPMPFLPMPVEANPALGLRGLRTSLWRPDLLEAQLRAILATAARAPCRLLLPMVTDVADIVAVRECLSRIARESDRAAPALGIMVETPACAMLADQLAPLVDFFSIGSNDLSQYVLAIDRLHPVLAARLDGLHPAVLRTISTAARAALANDRELCVCGGLASDPDAVPLLVGMGVRELSVPPSMVGRIKNVVRRYDRDQCERLAAAALALGSAADVRTLVRTGDGATFASVGV